MENITKRDLARAEIEVCESYFEKSALKNLQMMYKTSEYLFTNLKPINIVVPIADRWKHLNNFLKSVEKEIDAYGFPHSLISVNIVNDSREDVSLDNKNLYSYNINVRNITDQIEFLLDSYSEKLLRKVYGSFIKEIPKDTNSCREKKGSGSTMNVARLIMNKTVDANKSIIWFIDSDEEFSLLTKKDNKFEIIENPFSSFHTIQDIFEYYNADIVTGKITWDPAFSAPQMIKTQLIDIINNTKENPPIKDYFHKNRAYNDMNLFSQEWINEYYNTGYPLLPIEDQWKTNNDPAYSILLWHHISRPICYSNPDKILKNWMVDRETELWNIIRPGNVAGNKKLLMYPSMFVETNIRLHGPILGELITKMGEKIHITNLPLYHRRIADIEDIKNWYRWWTNHQEELIDISNLRMKQIEWDIISKYLQETSNVYSIERALFEDIKNKIIQMYELQINDIESLLENFKETSNFDIVLLRDSLLYSVKKIKNKMKENLEISLKEALELYKNYQTNLLDWNKLLIS